MTDIPSTHPITDILDTPAFDEAYLELTRYAYTRARNAAEADEVVSDTVLPGCRICGQGSGSRTRRAISAPCSSGGSATTCAASTAVRWS